jgi:hypothetical protein
MTSIVAIATWADTWLPATADDTHHHEEEQADALG